MIRDLDPRADRAAVEALFVACAPYVERERGPVPPAESARATFAGDLPPGAGGRVVLGVFEGELLGIAEVIFGYPLASDAYLGLLLLLPDARGRGLGRAMLREVEARAEARGAARLLVAVLDVNEAGRRFWEREGFREERRFAGVAYGRLVHDVTRMAKALGTGRASRAS